MTPKAPGATRLMTYNVHSCIGADRRVDVGRVAATIAEAHPDIVCLQEVDVGRARTEGLNQAHEIARRLGMSYRFNAALRVEAEQYGDAVLSALPERLVKAGPLPMLPRVRGLEPRGALWVAITLPNGREVQVINTHLGLAPPEQRVQTRALTGPEWLGAPEARNPLLLVGDLNATSRYPAYHDVARRLRDLQKEGQPRTLKTFPARLPVLRIDHVFASPGVVKLGLFTVSTPLAREASDHLPLVVDFTA